MQDTQEQVKQQLISIYNKTATGLPDWSLLVDVARLAKYKRNFNNTTFATWTYYAIKDLLSPVMRTWTEFINIHKKNKSVTTVDYEYPVNGFITKSKPEKRKVDENLWHAYKPQTVEQLNINPTVFEIPKMDKYLLTSENPIREYLNNKDLKENLDKIYLPVIDSDITKQSFEKVVKKLLQQDLSKNMLGDNNKQAKDRTIKEILVKKENYDFVLQQMSNWGITNDSGQCILTPKKKYLLYAFMVALRSEKVIYNTTTNEILSRAFCKHLGINYTKIDTRADGYTVNLHEIMSFLAKSPKQFIT